MMKEGAESRERLFSGRLTTCTGKNLSRRWALESSVRGPSVRDGRSYESAMNSMYSADWAKIGLEGVRVAMSNSKLPSLIERRQ